MGNNPFVNGKNHTSNFSGLWETTQRMEKQALDNKNPLIKKIADLIAQSEYADNWKALSLKAKLGETTVRDILIRTGNPGLKTLEKILRVLGKDWSDVVAPSDGAPIDIAKEIQELRETIHEVLSENMRLRQKGKRHLQTK